MTSFSIAGLSSGIDTTSVISQLMSIAAGPQTALKNQLSNTQNQASAYQAINTKMAALKTAADNVALASTWAATTATSSDSSIVATGSSTALAGTSTTFAVSSVAAAQISTVSPADPTNVATAANGLDVTIGTTTTHVALGGNGITDVASAINSAGLGVKAAVVTTSNGSILQFTSTSTGAASAFSISGLSTAPQTLMAAQDASITVGDPTKGGYTVTSSTNTFANAIPGVTFTVSKPVASASIAVTTDSTSISNAVKSLVSAANDALTIVSQATAQGAILEGNNAVSSLTQSILGVVSSGAGASSASYSTAGISMTSTGSLTFDATAFASAYAKNPSSIQTMVQTNFSSGLSAVGTLASDSSTGTITQLITSDNNQISSLNKQISDWNTRLADQKTSLQAKYAAMEAALSKLKSESGYLTSMFNSMSGQSSSSSSSSSSSTG